MIRIRPILSTESPDNFIELLSVRLVLLLLQFRIVH